ncbi:hypothetical protein VTK56DRAFT_2351 [Thermocarpiscus australiensis]
MADQAGLFTLTPLNGAARWVVEQPENQTYRGNAPGKPGVQSLIFHLYGRSKTAGRLATFGRHEQCDIRLPARPPPTTAGGGSALTQHKGGRSYQNYRNEHCFFFLAPSGELILRDLSPRLTHVEVEDATDDETKLYALHGNPIAGPRQRVIPRGGRRVYISIGSDTQFEFEWHRGLWEHTSEAQAFMADRARSLAVTGMTLTAPGLTNYEPPSLHSHELRSCYSPSSASNSGPYKSCHKYKELGSGGFGVVYKVVDLSNGELWAVKEIRNPEKSERRKPGDIDRLRVSLIREVNTMSQISHAHIVHYETYQDFRIGGTFQIFYKLYEGNLASMIPHVCSARPAKPQPWMPKMVKQIASAIEYLHEQGVLHLDIKPENILFDHNKDPSGPDFYLGDLGLAGAEAEFRGAVKIGTPFYMAPEIQLGLSKPCQASDIWSFAMTIGTALGFWCQREALWSASQWAAKLKMLGGRYPYIESAQWSGFPYETFYRRLAAVVALGILPPMFESMLLDHGRRPTATQCLKAGTSAFLAFPSQPEPLEAWAGLDLPWLGEPKGSRWLG